MKREEQILRASVDYNFEHGMVRVIGGDKIVSEEEHLLFNRNPHFIAGAEWADANPKELEIYMEDVEKAAEETISKEWKIQQEHFWNVIEKHLLYKFIKNACEYLKAHKYEVSTEDNGIVGWIDDDFILNFKKAMEQ